MIETLFLQYRLHLQSSLTIITAFFVVQGSLTIITYNCHRIFIVVQASFMIATYNCHSIFIAHTPITIITYGWDIIFIVQALLMIITYDHHSIFYIVQASLMIGTYNHHSIFIVQVLLIIATYSCKAFCEFLFRTVYYGDYLRVPYNNQK